MSKKNSKYYLISICLIVLSCNQSRATKKTIFHTFTFSPSIYDMSMKMDHKTFHSKYTKEHIQLDISYISGNKNKKNLPVIYLTDGYWRQIDHKYIHYLSYLKIIPPVLIVGVGYTHEYDDPRIQKTRMKDLYDIPVGLIESFTYEIFLLLKIIIPVIPKNVFYTVLLPVDILLYIHS